MIENDEVSKQRAIELWGQSNIDTYEVGTIQVLQNTHRYLFQDVFDFAGEIRNENISKGNFRFAGVEFLYSILNIIDTIPQTNFNKIIQNYVEMNIAHPFRKGNGSETRLLLDSILKQELRIVVDRTQISKKDYLSAMERSPAEDLEIRIIIKASLTDDLHNHDVFMKGLEQSYMYELSDDSEFTNLSAIISKAKKNKQTETRRKQTSIKDKER